MCESILHKQSLDISELSIRSEESGSHAVIKPEGALELYNSLELRKVILLFAERSDFKIIVDLDRIKTIDSGAIGMLVNVMRQLRRQNGPEFILANLCPDVRKSLEIHRMTSIFNIQNNPYPL